jgi:hypothetical protein
LHILQVLKVTLPMFVNRTTVLYEEEYFQVEVGGTGVQNML